MLSGEPRQRLISGRDVLQRHARNGVGDVDRTERRVDQPGGGEGRVQVVTPQPIPGPDPLVVVVRLRQLDGVGAQQVVEAVPAGLVLDEQVVVRQFAEQPLDLCHRDGGDAGRRFAGELRARAQRQLPEQSRAFRAESLVGPGQDRSDIGGLITGGQAGRARPRRG